MSEPVDLNAAVQQTVDAANATLAQAQALAAKGAAAIDGINVVVSKLSTVADTLQAALNEALIVEKDADGTIKNVKFKWPLA